MIPVTKLTITALLSLFLSRCGEREIDNDTQSTFLQNPPGDISLYFSFLANLLFKCAVTFFEGEFTDTLWARSTKIPYVSTKYGATCSAVCSFAHTTHPFACSALLAWLAHSAAFTRLLTSLAPLLDACGNANDWMAFYPPFFFGPQCTNKRHRDLSA